MSTVHGQGVLIPSTTRRDLVFDFAGQNLYISNSTGIVQTFNLPTQSFGTSYNLGGSLNGLDIARDNSFLLIAQNVTSASEGTFHKVNLTTGMVTNINYTRSDEDGAWDVTIAANGLALATTQGINSVPVRQINLTTNVISIRSDVPGGGLGGEVPDKTQIHRSTDGTRFFLKEGNGSGGAVFSYDATSDTFGPNARTDTFTFNASAAVSRNGRLVAFQNDAPPASLDTLPEFNYVHNFNGIDGGVAFDALSDVLYAVNTTTDQIIAYSTQTFAELFRLTIGENMPAGSTPFGTGVLVASADGQWLALETPSGIRLFQLGAVPTPTPSPIPTPTAYPSIPPGGNLLIPSTVRRDLVFDHSGQNLYISNSTGIIQTFNLSTLSFGTSYYLGGSLRGMDIARDNSFLLVAQNGFGIAEGTFQKVALPTGTITNIVYSRSYGDAIGAWDVAIGSNGLAFVTTQFVGLGWVPLRQIDLATNVISVRQDGPGSGNLGWVSGDTQIHRSADGSRFFLMEGNYGSDGNIFTYSASSNTFGQSMETFAFNDSSSGAVDRAGNLVAFRQNGSPAFLYTPPDLNFVRSFNGIDGGVAFDAAADVLYGVNASTDEIIAYSTQTFAELFRLIIGENMSPGSTPFGTGVLVASANGQWLALETPLGIRLFLLSATPPTPTPSPSATTTPSATATPSPTTTPSATPTPISTPTPTSTPTAAPARALNISTRLRVETGNNVLIGGFIITGTSPKNVAVRGIGPSLTPFGIPDALLDPTLELRDSGGALIRQNDNWQDDPSQASQLASLGLALQNPNESGIVDSLSPAAYTAILAGNNGGTGVGLVEIYDTSPGADSQLANISTRGFVQTGNNVMIGGFILGGANNTRVVVRGIGPSLGLDPVLVNPTLELRDNNGALLVSNDDWQDDPLSASQLTALGLAPTNPAESGIHVSLLPGAFTAILAGQNGGTGIGLVEIYNVH